MSNTTWSSILFDVGFNHFNFDVAYMNWLWWIVKPVLITFLLPMFFVIFFYGAALFLHIYKIFYSPDVRPLPATHTFWDEAKKLLAIMAAHAKVWHGYQLFGMEHIPSEGPVLIIFYHGVLPVDYYYALTRVFLFTGRHVWTVGDRFLYWIPGWKMLVEILRLFPGSVENCVELLHRGEMVGISPGGVREAFFSDEYYTLLWQNRRGFAKIAFRSKAEVHVMFTRNLREAYRTPPFGRSFLRSIYEKTRLPLVPIYGGFPVKMRTYISPAIDLSHCRNPDEVAVEIQVNLERLIRQYQPMPGSIFRGLIERVVTPWSHVGPLTTPHTTRRTVSTPPSTTSTTSTTPLTEANQVLDQDQLTLLTDSVSDDNGTHTPWDDLAGDNLAGDNLMGDDVLGDGVTHADLTQDDMTSIDGDVTSENAVRQRHVRRDT